MIKNIQNILLILSMLLIAGCIYIPIPEHGNSMIADDAMKFFKPGKTTRADVLLRFGDPIQRLEEDRFFIYHWETIIGYTIVALGYGGSVSQNENVNYLCLEFTSENLLKRWKHFERGYSWFHPEKQILEWMEEN